MARDTKLVEPEIVRRAVVDSFVKLNPRTLMRNPVMFVVGVGSVLTTILFFKDLGTSTSNENVFTGLVALFLWFTVLFANFAEAIAEGRGKAQAETLRKTRSETVAHRRRLDGSVEDCPSTALDLDDECVVTAGEWIPSDGEVIEGIASVDESAITGESAPVIRESGGDRSAVTGGTRVLSDEIVVRITARPGETFIDRMIALVEGSSRQKTPNEIALNILLVGLTIVFLLATVSLQPFAMFRDAEQPVVILVALLVCLIPTTIGALLSAIGIAGMDRLVRRNVLAMSGRAVEAAGDCATLLLDKTGTITFGNRQADAFVPADGVTEQELADVAQLSSLADETPEGRSIVVLAKEKYGIRERELVGATLVAFTAQTRMSGVDFDDRRVRKGAADSVRRWVEDQGGEFPEQLGDAVDSIAAQGGTPLVVAEAGAEGSSLPPRPLGVIYLKDIVKPGIAERFADLRKMGIRTVMITGDNPRTVAVIAEEAGVDDFLAEATPEDKMNLIKAEQRGGRLVAMTGDGTNDAPARAGRRRCRDEHGDAGGQRGGEHGRPRLRPDQAHRHRRDRQAAADHARIAHDLLDRQRRRQVLRDHSRDVRGLREPEGARPAQRHGPAEPALGNPLGRDLQCADHRGVDPARAARREVRAGGRGAAAAEEPADLRPRWGHRTLHRHQAHRHDRHCVGSEVMRRQFIPSIISMVIFTVALGIVFPLVVLGVGQLAFHDEANGSIIECKGTAVGSSLIGQSFTDKKGNPLPEYFQSRPSAAVGVDGTTEAGYDPTLSSGSNLGPTNPDVPEAGAAAGEGLPRAERPGGLGRGPGRRRDRLGLRPRPAHLDRQRAVAGEARGRRAWDQREQGQPAGRRQHVGRALGILGEKAVNVVELNLALDKRCT